MIPYRKRQGRFESFYETIRARLRSLSANRTAARYAVSRSRRLGVGVMNELEFVNEDASKRNNLVLIPGTDPSASDFIRHTVPYQFDIRFSTTYVDLTYTGGAERIIGVHASEERQKDQSAVRAGVRMDDVFALNLWEVRSTMAIHFS